MLTKKQQLFNMMVMQNDMNKLINPTWWKQGWPWRFAIASEAEECREHLGGWKWWKHHPRDMNQTRMEVVDILHFGLSLVVQDIQIQINDEPEAIEEVFNQIADLFLQTWDYDADLSETSYHDYLDVLTLEALSQEKFAVTSFRALCDYVELSFDDLYNLYMHKNVLNIFRQHNGYKEGRYMKVWPNGREDNQVMTDLMEEYPGMHPKDMIKVMQTRYNNAVQGLVQH